MNTKIEHPWWGHVPALLCVLFMTLALATIPMSAPVPIHFDGSGHPTEWGAVWILWIVFVVIPSFTIVCSFITDELFCRFEQYKKFNIFALFDDGLVGFLAGIEIAMLPLLSERRIVLKNEMLLGILIAVLAILAAMVLECLRKHTPCTYATDEGLKKSSDIELKLECDENWVHQETQDPLYLRLVMIAMFIIFGASIIVTFLFSDWLAVVFIFLLPIPIIFYGGMHMIISSESLIIRLGILRIPLVKISCQEIISAQVVLFSPINDFGGWGIRYSKKYNAMGYFLSGTEGVKIETRIGKNYIIGSNNVNLLAKIFNAVIHAEEH